MVLKLSGVLLVVLFLQQTYAIEDYANSGLRTVIRVYDECSKAEGGFVPCLKKKAISFLDKISAIDKINIGDGIKVLRVPEAPTDRALSENELEDTLSRGIDDRDSTLTNLLIERVANFFNGHTLQVSFPKMTSDEIGRGLEEGRSRMKKMMNMMMMGMAMKLVGMIPVAIAALYVLAGKALIVSKIALLLAAIIGLKKILSGRGGGAGGSGGGWSSGGSGGWSGGGAGGWSSGGGGGGGHGGGWDRRSMDAAQDLAYSAYSKEK